MTEKEFKAYLDMVVEKAFKEGVRYEKDRVTFGYPEDWISVELVYIAGKPGISHEKVHGNTVK